MSDLIERQAAIDTLCDWICGVGERCVKTHCQCIRRIEAMPSVQPDVPDTNVGDMISRQPEPYEDAVSRHRLLNDLKELIAAWEEYPVMVEQIKGVEVAIGYVKTIPPVTPKPEPLTDNERR